MFSCTVAAIALAPAAAEASSFRVQCASSHLLPDDPIVFPGRPGASHRHEFFGSRATTATSTSNELRRSASTCSYAGDTASYWTPTLEVSGRLVRGRLEAYYERGGKRRAAAPPPGLRVVVGNPMSTTPQARSLTSWTCVGRTPRGSWSRVPSCRAGEQLGAWVRFPDCWNGRTLDSFDHRSHMAYARGGRCAASHPVELMRLSMLVTWNVRPRFATAVTLGDGMLASTGMHGDFWNTWSQGALDDLRWRCIEVARSCGRVLRPAAAQITRRGTNQPPHRAARDHAVPAPTALRT